MEGIHLIIFCKSDYRTNFLNHCVFSINENVNDKIISKTIVTDQKFEYSDFDVIQDIELWELIDNTFQYKKLYLDTWYRQQILKLSVDHIKTGDILVVDADLVFLKPVQFVKNQKYNFYTAEEFDPRYFNTIDHLLKIKKQTKESFVSDFSLFNSSILESLKFEVEENHKKYWLSVLDNVLPKSIQRSYPYKQGFLLSEYEMYGNFFLAREKRKLNKLIKPVNYRAWVDIKKPLLSLKESDFLNFLKKRSDNYYQSFRSV